MRIAILSDLHFEFHRDGGSEFISTLKFNGIDVLILAGDIVTPAEKIPNILERFCNRYETVVYLPGNHEFYRSSFPEVKKIFDFISISNLHILDNKTTTINGQRFVGTTLWFRDQPDYNRLYKCLADFQEIKDFRNHVYEKNRLAIEFLNHEVNSSDIVITHHMPSKKSVHPKFTNSSLNRFFVCELDDLINERQPKLWVHGHTHESCDYYINKTRIICNPLGYPNEKSSIRTNLLIEI